MITNASWLAAAATSKSHKPGAVYSCNSECARFAHFALSLISSISSSDLTKRMFSTISLERTNLDFGNFLVIGGPLYPQIPAAPAMLSVPIRLSAKPMSFKNLAKQSIGCIFPG